MPGSENRSEQMANVGQLLKGGRRQAGLSLKTCAQILGISEEQYTSLENGSVEPSLPQIEFASRVFGIPISRFWDGSGSDEPIPPELTIATVLDVRRRMIGVLIRQARLAAGKSVAECADHLGIQAGSVTDYEYGKRDIPFGELVRLSGYLGIPVSYFVDEQIAPQEDDSSVTRQELGHLSERMLEFISHPGNLSYLNIALLLSELSPDMRHRLGESLLGAAELP